MNDGYNFWFAVFQSLFDLGGVYGRAPGSVNTMQLSSATLDNVRHAIAKNAVDADQGLVTGLEFARGNADAAEELNEDDGSLGELALRASDHDGLVLYIFRDEDKDGVSDDLDVCPATTLPEAVPTRELGTNRFADTDGDGVFNTVAPKGKGPRRSYDIHETAGCSCEQIIEAQSLDDGHTKFGCSIGAMDDWTKLVQ